MSFITKKHIPRRRFLQASGVTLALPMLEAMLPASTALAQTPAGQVKPRFVGVFFPHGMAPGYWSPEAEGPLPEKEMPPSDAAKGTPDAGPEGEGPSGAGGGPGRGGD
jgi:hypothetical protein